MTRVWCGLIAVALFFGASGVCAAEEEARHLFVAPHGKPDGDGTQASPLDFASAFVHGRLVAPGTTVWLAGGRYEGGPFRAGGAVRGTKEQPVVFRAVAGERTAVVGGLDVTASHVWIWGMEIVGPSPTGVHAAGEGLRVINCIIHDNRSAEKPPQGKPNAQGIGGGQRSDQEFYGNLIYHNGWSSLDHAMYMQNTARQTPMRIIDNILFENAGCGLHVYGEAPVLSGFHVEGNICFATSRNPADLQTGQMNILLGGRKPISNIVLKANCTWHPQAADSKRGVDVGYRPPGNTNILIEDNYFTCGANALELKGVLDATVRRNVFWAPRGMVQVTFAPEADRSKVLFENNVFVANGSFDPKKWLAETGVGGRNRLVPGRDGRPAGLHTFARVNQYEPGRVHLAIYNWDHRPAVRIHLPDVLQKGDAYRVVNVLDFYGPPVAQGEAQGPGFVLPMGRHRYEPEFGAYLLFRSRD